MGRISFFINATLLTLAVLLATPLYAATWRDDFNAGELQPTWRSDRDNFEIQNGYLKGFSFHPILTFLRFIEVGQDWADYTASCKINIVQPNISECTKGALVLRHKNNEGYVFALHIATQHVEVYRLSGGMLLSVPMALEWKTWYHVRAELQDNEFRFFVNDQQIGALRDSRSPSGAVGIAVEDTMEVQFDDFAVTGPEIPADVTPKGKIAVRWASIKTRK